MNSSVRHNRYSKAAHITGWIIFFSAPLLLSPEGWQFIQDPRSILSLTFRNIILMGLFYFNLLYLTPKFLLAKGPILFFAALLFLVIIISAINFAIHDALVEGVGRHDRPHGAPPFSREYEGMPAPRGPRLMVAGPFFSSLLITSVVASFSTLIVFWKNIIRAKEYEQERSLQKISAELSILKLQISPHFLFNTLNNIRWLVRSKSDQAEPAVVKLSQLLRYVLYQSNQETVSLEKELEHLADYVMLQKMRLPQNDFRYEVIGESNEKVIEPLLLIPIVENFFKHADFSKPGNSILITIESNRIIVTTQNSTLPKSNETDLQASGIGLENIRKRLALHYSGKHLLTFGEAGGVFSFHMELIVS